MILRIASKDDAFTVAQQPSQVKNMLRLRCIFLAGYNGGIQVLGNVMRI